MKKILPFLLFICNICNAQNFQCLQSGVKHYFINGNGYLRGIRIDSTRTTGDTTVFYPFHTPRGSYNTTGLGSVVLDTNGGSWLGKKVLYKSDGTFIFDSYWNDSVIIKTRASVGDSWILYRDTSSVYYKATVISTDTMRILSTLDSVKRIRINTYDTTSILTSDSLNGFEIVLSKNNGFVQVFDLYTFPYHKPDSVYRAGLDFFLDRSTQNYGELNTTSIHAPSGTTAIFKLVNFINPNDQQLHNWNLGDTIEGYHAVGGGYPAGPCYKDYILEVVSNKTISSHTVSYTLTGTNYSCTFHPGCDYPVNCSYYWDPCTVIVNATTYIFHDTTYPFIDTISMPEENLRLANHVFYFPDDISLCLSSPEYIIDYSDYTHYNSGSNPIFYKLGIGQTYNTYWDGDCIVRFDDGIAYTNINGVPCGILHPPTTSVDNTPTLNSFINIYPNPTSSSITISAPDKISTVSITNLLGQTLFNSKNDAKEISVDVSGIPSGIYLIRINGLELKKFVKQ